MRHCLLFSLLLVVWASPGMGQEADTLKHWGWSVGAGKSKAIVVDQYQRMWQKGKDNFSFEMAAMHVALPCDSDEYAADYGYPSIAAAVRMAFNHGVTMHKNNDPAWGLAEEVDYDSRMGNSIALYGTFTRPFFRKGKWEADYALSMGVGYSHHFYDPNHSVDNELIGSRWLIYFGAGAHLAYQVSNQWALKVGIDYWHLSNGALDRPNKGANFIGPTLAAAYRPYYNNIAKGTAGRFRPHFDKYFFSNFAISVGAKALNEEWLETQFRTPKGEPGYRTKSFNIYLAYAAQADIMYRYARRWASGIGFDLFYATYADKVESIDKKNNVDVEHSPWSLGIAIKHQAYYHRLALAVSIGAYLHRKMGQNASQIEKPYYERVTLLYNIPKMGGINVGIGVKAHLTKADYTELMATMPIKW